MSDFPHARFHKPVISSVSTETPLSGTYVALGGAAPTGSGAYPTANLAMYVPFQIWTPYLVRRVWWANGTTTIAGNVDVGVYAQDGTRLFSAGATAQATASINQSVALGTPSLLSPGSYYMAFSSSSNTATFFRLSVSVARVGQMFGLAQEATANPLPATFTQAAFAQTIVPVFGIASATVI